MIDREKIIKGLTDIYDEAYDRWVHCQYSQDKLLMLIDKTIPDALALLREDGKPVPRPARLMTEEEVLSQPEGAVVWRECHLSNEQYELRPMVCDGKRCCGDFGLSVECKYDFGCRDYVRYWTNKPTDEQRKAVKWNE